MVKQGVFGAEDCGFAYYGLCGGVACLFCYYQTARYLADTRPDEPEHQQLWVDLLVCIYCGARVHDAQQHSAGTTTWTPDAE